MCNSILAQLLPVAMISIRYGWSVHPIKVNECPFLLCSGCFCKTLTRLVWAFGLQRLNNYKKNKIKIKNKQKRRQIIIFCFKSVCFLAFACSGVLKRRCRFTRSDLWMYDVCMFWDTLSIDRSEWILTFNLRGYGTAQGKNDGFYPGHPGSLPLAVTLWDVDLRIKA